MIIIKQKKAKTCAAIYDLLAVVKKVQIQATIMHGRQDSCDL